MYIYTCNQTTLNKRNLAFVLKPWSPLPHFICHATFRFLKYKCSPERKLNGPIQLLVMGLMEHRQTIGREKV